MLSLFRCLHKKTTFPITLKIVERARNSLPRTYMVCLDCGKELPYSWAEMKLVKRAWLSISSLVRKPAQRFG